MASKDVMLKGKISICREDFMVKFKMTKEKVLGRGMSGYVVLSSYKDDPKKKKALKIFHDSALNAKLFVMEVSMLQKVNHPNIIADVMAFACPGSFILTMPYYPDGSLTQHLHHVTKDQVNKYFLQLASAIHYLHDNGIAHRDVKPDNVMLNEDGDVILIDFGLACPMTPDVDLSLRPGTRLYMAPEMFKEKEVDFFKCDLYALGVVLWNMVFKREVKIPIDYLKVVDHFKQLPTTYRSILYSLLYPDPKGRWNDQQLVQYLPKFSSMNQMANRLWGRESVCQKCHKS